MAAAQTTDPAPAIKVQPPATPANCSAVDAYNWDVKIAYAICMAESTGNPNATGYNTDGSVDRGLMQINSIHADMVGGDLSALYSPAVNIKIAYSLSKAGTDWSAWSTYNNGKYLKWL